ncbi:MAG: hypothetical protein WB992_12460, partial [Bryobacteraceae bacterium]
MVSVSFKTLLDQQKPSYQAGARTAIHSGNAGDLLYSLPSVRALGVRHLFLNVYRDPDPNWKLTHESAMGLAPLLLAQDYIDRVTVVTAGVPLQSVDPECIGVDYILDQFRNQDFTQMHLMHSYALAMKVEIDPNEPFLSVPLAANGSHADLVIASTPRYRLLSEEFIRQIALYFGNIVILALPEEWRVISGTSGEVRKCRDFLEMAQIINGSGLFVGNPSLASAVAEGLKVPRIIDLPVVANAFPIGPRGYVLPTRRGEFLDMVRHLCPDNLKVSSMYADLNTSIRNLTVENEKLREVAASDVAGSPADQVPAVHPSGEAASPEIISLAREASNPRFPRSGGREIRVEEAHEAIYMHPASGATG